MSADLLPVAGVPVAESPWRDVVRRFLSDDAAVAGLVVLGVLVLSALLAPWIVPPVLHQSAFDLGIMDFDGVAPRLEASAGTVTDVSIDRLPEGNAARVGFHFLRGEVESAEFRLWLESEGAKASEIWLYRWSA